jgi:hypothetical protein
MVEMLLALPINPPLIDTNWPIIFKNVTGLGFGAGGGTGFEQEGYASTVTISARKAGKARAGSNSISIAAGQDVQPR